jgi:glutamate synthase (NADPH/NADH) large chain
LDMRRAIDHWKADGLDLSPILHIPSEVDGKPRRRVVAQDHGLESALDVRLLEMCRSALEKKEPVRANVAIRNVNRTVGTMLGSAVTRAFGGQGLPDGTIDITFQGSAGQSFGAFIPAGITLRLEGDANDYVGQGLSGGRITVRPDRRSTFAAEDNIIAGNVIAYGATSGEIFIRGQVGERFCVRNSGAHAVVEGVGDHALEYMTGGLAVILGGIGRNLGAGMSGGVAYVLDLKESLVNLEMVDLDPLDQTDVDQLRSLILRHVEETDSSVGAALLSEWNSAVRRFTKVMPQDFKRVLRLREEALARGEDPVVAVMGGHGG